MDFITGLPYCIKWFAMLFFTCVDCFDKVHCFDCMYFKARGVKRQNRLCNCFSRVLLDSLACLTILVHDRGLIFLLQSSGLNFGIPWDLVLSLVVPITPKLVVRWRSNIKLLK